MKPNVQVYDPVGLPCPPFGGSLPHFFASHLPGIKDTTRYRNQQEAKCDLVLVGHYAVNRYLYNMKSIVITPKNKSEFEFVSSLVKKLGLASRTLSLEDKEDAGLGILMSQADRSSTVKKSTVLKNLQ